MKMPIWKVALVILVVSCMLVAMETYVEMPLDGWVYDAAVESQPMMRPVLAKTERGKVVTDDEQQGRVAGRYTRYSYDPETTTLFSSFVLSREREALQLLSS